MPELDPTAEVATRKHIARVGVLLRQIAVDLLKRADAHDASKLESPEVEVLSEQTARLAGLTYMSDEYKAQLAAVDMKSFFDHHYARNRHHPEHHKQGVRDMTFMDLTEMLVDWMAASERHADGNILTSIAKNAERFGYGSELADILVNTVKALALTS